LRLGSFEVLSDDKLLINIHPSYKTGDNRAFNVAVIKVTVEFERNLYVLT
jgi:hypothetical protein